jgi:hypothetical protein
MELLKPETTEGKWVLEMSDLTIRCKNFDNSNLMGDYKGNIIADLKPSLGITEEDVKNGSLSTDYVFSYLNDKGGRQHAFNEVIANGNSICDIMNNIRGIK